MAAANDLGGGDRLVRVAAVNDYEIIVAGVAAMLRQFPDRLEVVDQIIVGEPLSEPGRREVHTAPPMWVIPP